MLILPAVLFAQNNRVFKGKVTDEAGAALSLATIRVQGQDIAYYAGGDGLFIIPLAANTAELTLIVSHVGLETQTRTFSGESLDKLQVIKLAALNLKLPEVEVNGVRRKTSSSNSSIIFDREAIEQSQALSVANVLAYLPGQTIIKPTITVQTATALTLRTATPPAGEQALNQAFGISIQIDGATVSNNANMQTINPASMGFTTANQIDHPENSVIRDRSYRNGTLFSSYTGDAANSGIDLRQIPAENIESIEVISGVASARYGDYTTGVLNIERQAGITPWRVNMRTNEGTQNVGLNKGIRLSPRLGVVNFSFDYLNSNDDPRNKIKAFQRIGGSVLWTYKPENGLRFKNTLSLDFNTTLDQTKLDPEVARDQMAKFTSRTVRVSNRSEWIINKPWLYNISVNGNYSYGRQESYEQQYMNSNAVLGITNAMESGTHEGSYVPGYYLAIQQIIGEPVNAGARIEARSILKAHKATYQFTVGGNYSYSGNHGPGVIIDPSRPSGGNTGDKNDRPRPFRQIPSQSNAGFYFISNVNTQLLGRPFFADAGIRGDVQNGHYSISPRINSNWKLTERITWNVAYGIATKAPALSQINPGNTYYDIPLVSAYTGKAAESVFLVHTQVFNSGNPDLKPYRSYTFETGFNIDAKPVHLSLFYFNRINKDGFANNTYVLPVTLPNYSYTYVPGQKVTYAPDGTYKTWHLTYNKLSNAAYSRTNGLELMVGTRKIKALQTSFSASTSFYHSYFVNSADDVNLSATNGQSAIDTSRVAWYGVFRNQEGKSLSIKSTIVSTTHIPALRMAVMFSGEIFWMNRQQTMANGIYPVGYLDRYGNYTALTAEQAQSEEYKSLRKKPQNQSTIYTPALVYPNVSMRVSKEIGDMLRFSFNAYNVFNIRPAQQTATGTNYYNGQPSFGAELIITIK